jgi:hypothetical protein
MLHRGPRSVVEVQASKLSVKARGSAAGGVKSNAKMPVDPPTPSSSYTTRVPSICGRWTTCAASVVNSSPAVQCQSSSEPSVTVAEPIATHSPEMLALFLCPVAGTPMVASTFPVKSTTRTMVGKVVV